MTNDHRTPEQIEREIELQRSELTSNLENLQDKFSIDALVRQIGDQFREHGGDIGRSVSDQIKTNPIPLALTGIGLAWMMFNSGQKPRTNTGSYNGYSDVEEDFRRLRREQGLPYTPPVRRAYNADPSWARDGDSDAPSVSERVSEGVDHLLDGAANSTESMRKGFTSAASSVAEGASSTANALSDAASSAGSAIASGAKSFQSGIVEAGSRIAEGTESLTEEGRQRVIAARQKAVEMRRSAAQSISQSTDAAADFYDRQPLVIGALALAVGAALGGALPRTKAEDDLMGSQSDKFYDEAERIFHEEKSKAIKVAKSVKDEIHAIADETQSELDSAVPGDKSAIQALGDQVKAAADRVVDTAEATAKDVSLGKPNT